MYKSFGPCYLALLYISILFFNSLACILLFQRGEKVSNDPKAYCITKPQDKNKTKKKVYTRKEEQLYLILFPDIYCTVSVLLYCIIDACSSTMCI